jgi:hypothetical protein
VKKIQISVYHEDNAKRRKKLVRRMVVESESGKRLTAGRAAKIIARHFPEHGNPLIVIKVDEGWWSSRTIRPTEKCSYHYHWEHVIVHKEEHPDLWEVDESKATETVYIQLLDEGVTCYRPTKGVRIRDMVFKILAVENYDPEDEKWEFLPGSIVRCEKMILEGASESSERLVAVDLAEEE